MRFGVEPPSSLKRPAIRTATGATTAENLAYAARLGLWGGPEAPFVTRDDFLDAMDKGGVAAMELVARELKALGLYVARSLTEVGDAWADGGRTAAAVLDRNVQLALSGGLWLKRSRVMDRWRLEVVGGRTDRDALVSLGCFVEIIAYAPRVFVPVDRPDVVEGVLRRHPVQSILEGAAA